eukprot:scaffold4099_cov115-Pinguiococcus_pyrenoidosus.AAC.1
MIQTTGQSRVGGTESRDRRIGRGLAGGQTDPSALAIPSERDSPRSKRRGREKRGPTRSCVPPAVTDG